VRAVSLHRDVIVVTSALLHLNCAFVRAAGAPGRGESGESGESREGDGGEGGAQECFMVDSPVLPEELALLPSLLTQAGYPAPSGLLATHADWDHLLGALAFPGTPLACAESTAERMRAHPGEAQRELRAFDEPLYLRREGPLAPGAVQALPVPGRCGIGTRELELHATAGHTGEGMALLVPWAGVLLVGDYLSAIEIPTLGDGGDALAYLATLERLGALLEAVERVVPGHGPVLERERARRVLEQDERYLNELLERGAGATLPEERRTREQRRLHAENVAAIA
jgi:glyoxylase-like metal-dependent hydrolase (beta-lactamase superfamily II)